MKMLAEREKFFNEQSSDLIDDTPSPAPPSPPTLISPRTDFADSPVIEFQSPSLAQSHTRSDRLIPTELTHSNTIIITRK